jgi:AcrR family transcriptional regulator
VTDASIAPGRHGIPPEEVAANQRWRLLGAAAEELAESGHQRTTSTRVAKRAGVSPATFYKHYENVADCLLASFQVAADCVWVAVKAGCQEPSLEWPRRLRDSLDSLLRFLAAEPAIAHMLGGEPAAGEAEIAAARGELLERLAGLLAEGRKLRAKDAAELPPNTELHMVSGALVVISDRVAAGKCAQLLRLAPQLAEMLAAPYLGSAAAT